MDKILKVTKAIWNQTGHVITFEIAVNIAGDGVPLKGYIGLGGTDNRLRLVDIPQGWELRDLIPALVWLLAHEDYAVDRIKTAYHGRSF